MSTPETRLQVVFADLRRAVDDVVLRHRVTPEELFAAVDWLRRVADAGELPLTGVLFLKSALQATEGAAYAHPETDGATPWEMEGPAHLPGSPELPSPAVLPMRPEEPGEPFVVSRHRPQHQRRPAARRGSWTSGRSTPTTSTPASARGTSSRWTSPTTPPASPSTTYGAGSSPTRRDATSSAPSCPASRRSASPRTAP
ncbi:hypothetical protein AB7952_09165 [Streptomyces sp. PG2]